MNDQPREAKQVLVVRKDLNMRKGKMVAQGAHASVSPVLAKLRLAMAGQPVVLDEAEAQWYFARFKKICVYVNSEAELDELHAKALAAGLRCYLVVDAGLTEFDGVPTKTVLGIGPHWPEDVDPITGGLPLL